MVSSIAASEKGGELAELDTDLMLQRNPFWKFSV